jgi:hypothetical protein
MEIGNIEIDFIIDTNFDPNLIIVGDMSKWYNAENLPSTICITPPGFTKSINNTFVKHKLNIFNSVNLGLSCLTECDEQELVDLSDGIWTITVRSGYAGIEKTRYLLKTDRLTMELDKIYIKTGLEYDIKDSTFREDLSIIEFLIRTAEAWVRQGNFVKAGRDFAEAQNILRKYSDCKNCL